MIRKIKLAFILSILMAVYCGGQIFSGSELSHQEQRREAHKLYKDGNRRDPYKVEDRAYIFVTDSVYINKQHHSHVPLGFSPVRFNCVRPLKGNFSRELWRYMDVAILGFSSGVISNERLDRHERVALGSEYIVFVNPLPDALKKFAFRGVIDAPGKTVEDIKAALLPASKDIEAYIRALTELEPLALETVVAEIQASGSWGRGIKWKLEVTKNGKVTYREFTLEQAKWGREEPKESLSKLGSISEEEVMKLVKFLHLDAPRSPETLAEDADYICFKYCLPGLVFERGVSMEGLRSEKEDLAKELMERVDELKKQLDLSRKG